jgi:hypothetical protein
MIANTTIQWRLMLLSMYWREGTIVNKWPEPAIFVSASRMTGSGEAAPFIPW